MPVLGAAVLLLCCLAVRSFGRPECYAVEWQAIQTAIASYHLLPSSLPTTSYLPTYLPTYNLLPPTAFWYIQISAPSIFSCFLSCSQIARLTRELEAARAQSRVVQSGALRTDEEARRFADEVGGLRARVAQLEGAHRAKAREVEALAASLDAARAAEAEVGLFGTLLSCLRK